MPSGKNGNQIGLLTLKKERSKIIEEKFGYSSEDNPFGDANLADPFIWRKKNAYLKAAGREVNSDPALLIEQARRKVSEIESVKRRREDREEEEKLLEEQRIIIEREREQENFTDYSRKEDDFLYEQALTRTQIRLTQGREKALDLLAKAHRLVQGEKFEDLSLLDADPCAVIEGLKGTELEEFVSELQFHRRNHDPYFEAIHSIVSAQNKNDPVLSEIPATVKDDVDGLLASKTVEDLDNLKPCVKQKLEDPTEDVSFWEAIEALIPLYRAKAEVRYIHKLAHRIADHLHGSDTAVVPSNNSELTIKPNAKAESDFEAPKRAKTLKRALSPKYLPYEEVQKLGVSVLDPREDFEKRKAFRQKILEKLKSKWKPKKPANPESSKSFDDFVRREMQNQDEGEEIMTDEALTVEPSQEGLSLSSSSYKEYEKKYELRRPRFFNRVKTGYDWNGYNRTHYDFDNPPPKNVIGYKFNIFYPDLLDPSIAPTWALTPDTSSTNCAILTFHGGPPYTDLAFKILNKEWCVNRFRGFRNVFDKGVLQLHFNLKRHRYRK